MKALILAAGYGTRLYALGKNTPKALLKINGKSLVNFLLDKVENLNDLNEVILVTNNKFYGIFQNWAKEQFDFPCAITIVNDKTNTPEDRLGSIGDIQYVLENHLVDDDLIVLGGDNLFDYSLNKYISFSKSKTDSVTIGLYDIEETQQAKLFGVVGLDDNKKIILFEEKPVEPKSTLIAMCFYYFPQKTLSFIGEYLREVKISDTAGDYIRWLIEKTDVYGFEFVGKWYDIGSVEAYEEAQEKFKT